MGHHDAMLGCGSQKKAKFLSNSRNVSELSYIDHVTIRRLEDV